MRMAVVMGNEKWRWKSIDGNVIDDGLDSMKIFDLPPYPARNRAGAAVPSIFSLGNPLLTLLICGVGTLYFGGYCMPLR